MGPAPSSVDHVHVVVVGGGFGGVAAAQRLQARGIRFTLIDMKDAFHHNVAALRASVRPGFARRTFVPYRLTFGDSFRQAVVEQVDASRQSVVLQGGEEIQYSHLVLCTGTDGPFPGKLNAPVSYQQAVQTYEELAQQIQAADSVLVVGGGSTGVEMAAELKTEHPQKRVVLVHSRSALADAELLASVRRQAKEVLLEKGVELLLGQKVLDLAGLHTNRLRQNTTIITDKGTRVTVDLVLDCSGLRINSQAYRSALCDALSGDGALKVDAHLQVAGFPNVYAVGDCADVAEPKTAYHARLHAAVAVSNIANSLSGRALTSYHTGHVTMLLAMGRDDGVGQLNGLRLPRCVVAMAKSGDLMLRKSWSEMKQTPPATQLQ